LGVSYHFPQNSTLAAGEAIYLAGDTVTFQAKYGEAPFGEFSRDLSNKNHNLVLVDAYGNVIDHVEYFDKLPWPESADGDGFYLELVDVNLDNAIASSWVASSSANLSTQNFDANTTRFTLFPNPVEDYLTINAQETIQEISIFNLLGQHIKNVLTDFKSGDINISELNTGSYILNLKLVNGANVSAMIFKK
jgi:hypothetical protein